MPVANARASWIGLNTSGGTSPIFRSSRFTVSDAMPCTFATLVSRKKCSFDSSTSYLLPRFCVVSGTYIAAHAANRDRAEIGLRLDESSQQARDRPARLHLDVGSSSWSSTSCSAARDRITSSASLSAASITCDTSARTSCEISGFHLLSFVSSFSAIASTGQILLPRTHRCNPQHLTGRWSEPRKHSGLYAHI
jgi:hypothetical protein